MAGENRTGRLEKCWATRSPGPRRALRRRRARFPAAPPGGPSGSRVHGRARTRRCRGAPSRPGPAAPELSTARTSCRRCVRAAVSPARVRSRIRLSQTVVCDRRARAPSGRACSARRNETPGGILPLRVCTVLPRGDPFMAVRTRDGHAHAVHVGLPEPALRLPPCVARRAQRHREGLVRLVHRVRA